MLDKIPKGLLYSISNKITERLRHNKKKYIETPALSLKGVVFAASVLAGMLVLVFGDLMVSVGDLVISKSGADIYMGALLGREYTFEQLRQGNWGFPCDC